MDDSQKGQLRTIQEIFSSYVKDIFKMKYVDIGGQVFWPSRYEWIFKALEMTKANKEDVLYDFGSGDGRVLAVAKTFFNVKKAKGIENNPNLAELSRKNIMKMEEERLSVNGIDIIEKNYLDADVSDGTLFYCYRDPFFDSHIDEVVKKFEELKEGSRIVLVGGLIPWKGSKNFEHSVTLSPPLPLTGIHSYVKKT
jgi:hypothetical protein